MEEKKFKKFLPIGTVVILKGAKKRVMVTGFCPRKVSDDKIFDYCGVPYPEGTIEIDKLLLFDHKQIQKVYHMGLYNDDEEKEFKVKLKNIINEKKLNG